MDYTDCDSTAAAHRRRPAVGRQASRNPTPSSGYSDEALLPIAMSPSLDRPRRSLSATLLALALCTSLTAWLTSPAHAQYQWRDASGQMVFSDRPPPATVPEDRVIRRPLAAPRSTASAAPAAAQGAQGASAPETAGTSAPTVASPATATAAERQLEAQRRAREQEAAERKRREDAEFAQKLARDCEALRGDLRTLESGMRITRVNPAGEREFMSDEERTQRIGTVRQTLQSRCTSG